MEEYVESPREEIKRADHLLFVTLKYTRTADVIKNTIERLVNAFELSMIDALKYAQKKKKIKSIPLLPKIRAENIKQVVGGAEIKNFIEFYFFLKAIVKSDYGKKNEFRKHVALISMQEDKVIEVDMDTLKQYFDRTVDFLNFIETWISETK